MSLFRKILDLFKPEIKRQAPLVYNKPVALEIKPDPEVQDIKNFTTEKEDPIPEWGEPYGKQFFTPIFMSGIVPKSRDPYDYSKSWEVVKEILKKRQLSVPKSDETKQ
jgi:hypothetical protein